MKKEDVLKIQESFESRSAKEIIIESIKLFGLENIALASSLAAEDQVLTDLFLKITPKGRIFTIDTGRLPQETYDVMHKSMQHYHFNYEVLFPDFKKVEEMVSSKGPNLFYESLDNRKLCCNIRKVEPLERKLKTLKAWISGLRRGQSITRTETKKLEWDDAHHLVKINPIADWTEGQVWNYIRQNKVPYNALHDKNYASIGCAPCTRPIKPGEDIRSGRWWWEKPEHKECGLHNRKANTK